VEGEIEKRLRSMRGKVRIKGFRPGKVPISLVKSRFGAQIQQEVLGEVINKSYQEAVSQEKVHPAGLPTIEDTSLKPGASLEYIAVFEVYPEVELASMQGVPIKRPATQVTEQDVDEMVERLRRQRRQWEPVERAAETGDRVTLDYRPALEAADGDDQPESGNARPTEDKLSGEGRQVILGESSLVPGFEYALLGASAGEAKHAQVTFPEEIPDKDLAGRTLDLELTVHKVEHPVLPGDDDLARSFLTEDGSIETLRQQVRAKMERDLAGAIKAQVKTQVMAALRERHQLELPQTVVKREIEVLRQHMKARLDDEKTAALPDAMFEEEARQRVNLGLVIGKISEVHDMHPNQDQVRRLVEESAAEYENPQNVINWYYAEPGRLSEIEMVTLEDQIVDWVLQQAEIADVPSDFKGALAGEAANPDSAPDTA